MGNMVGRNSHDGVHRGLWGGDPYPQPTPPGSVPGHRRPPVCPMALSHFLCFSLSPGRLLTHSPPSLPGPL